jgi:hypothetical protein
LEEHIAFIFSLSPAFTLVSWLPYSSTLKMEAICSSETSVDSEWTTQRYIPEDSPLSSPVFVNKTLIISYLAIVFYSVLRAEGTEI